MADTDFPLNFWQEYEDRKIAAADMRDTLRRQGFDWQTMETYRTALGTMDVADADGYAKDLMTLARGCAAKLTVAHARSPRWQFEACLAVAAEGDMPAVTVWFTSDHLARIVATLASDSEIIMAWAPEWFQRVPEEYRKLTNPGFPSWQGTRFE